MAAVTTGIGPWLVHAADAGATPVTAEVIQIERIVWDTGASGAAGDECKVTTNDTTPVVLVDFLAQGADGHIDQAIPKGPINGLIVPTLTHGNVLVYLR